VFCPFGRPAHVAGSPAPAVGAAHQILPIGKTLSIGQMLPIGHTLPIGQKLLIGKMLLLGPAPGICASAPDILHMNNSRHGLDTLSRGGGDDVHMLGVAAVSWPIWKVRNVFVLTKNTLTVLLILSSLPVLL
jgi:hypothetical protein